MFRCRAVQAAFFNSGFQGIDDLNFFSKSSDDGVYYSEQPVSTKEIQSQPIPVIDIPGDFGLWVRAIIEQKEVREDSRPVLCQSDSLLLTDIADILAQGHFRSGGGEAARRVHPMTDGVLIPDRS